MTKDPNSSDQQHFNVTLYCHERGRLGDGKLSFGGNRPTQVNFKMSVSVVLADGEQIALIRAVAENGRTYTLCICKFHGFRLYAEYLIESDIVAPEFDQIVVRYREVSEWFLHWQKIQGQIGDKLNWEQKSKPLSVTISSNEEQFTLSSDYFGSGDRVGEDLIVHEHVEFTFATTGRKFNLPDIRGKTHELSCLLSILIAYPATVMSVWVGLKNGHLSQVHFPGYTHPERDVSDSGFWIKWFIQKPKIEDRWQTIFDRYYGSIYRKICWVRLAGMQRYEGFWEYKSLGYVSLLDQYVTIRSGNSKKTMVASVSRKKLTAFRQEVACAMPSLSVSDADSISKVAGRVFVGTKQLTFGEKYRAAIAKTDRDIVKIISISETDFQFIKKIRDAIAHGDDPGLEGDDYSKVSDVVGKIALLLTYWAFLDFGLTTDDFVECLSRTHSSLRFSCILDSVHLARVSGTADFFSVTAEKFAVLSKLGVRNSLCFVREANGELSFSESYTKIYKDWEKNPSPSPGLLQPKEIFGVDNNAAKYFGHSYIESGENRLEVFSTWIINPS
ncbi:hypothetical protein GTP46_26770 [Duganella sp. FT135W]|uniref:Apea-like HEPN domain-containing protein n=1 Tax=Duganella flavida TaxID=2692175 RepID=A0A6L8KJ41_9BURK|nr:HEPN domain-containing protein [Duganella flavida]MYM26238.1 hypothetical protein [Duganella flavida]